MGKIFITSDLHFFHNQSFIYEPRGFNNVYDMSEAIIKNWNSVISLDDDVYVLGDLMLNDNTNGIRYIKYLNGKIHIILGNHDTDTRIELYKDCYNVVEIVCAKRLKYRKYNFYLSHYPTLTANYDDGKDLWAKTINLCGHTHTQDPFVDWDKGIIYHCELDAHNNTPILLDDIINDIQIKLNKEKKV